MSEDSQTNLEELKKKISDLTEDVKNIWGEIERLKIIGPSEDVKRIEDNIFKEFERFRNSMEKEMENLKKDFQSTLSHLSIPQQTQDSMDLKTVQKDIEFIKLRMQWLEKKLQKIKLDLEFWMERVDKVESLINRIRATSPWVIE